MTSLQQNPTEVFLRGAPDMAVTFNGLIPLLVMPKGIDPKTRQLICITMKTPTGDSLTVKANVPISKAAGTTKKRSWWRDPHDPDRFQYPGVVTCLPEAVKQFEK
jgi:hypothetical protein